METFNWSDCSTTQIILMTICLTSIYIALGIWAGIKQYKVEKSYREHCRKHNKKGKGIDDDMFWAFFFGTIWPITFLSVALRAFFIGKWEDLYDWDEE